MESMFEFEKDYPTEFLIDLRYIINQYYFDKKQNDEKRRKLGMTLDDSSTHQVSNDAKESSNFFTKIFGGNSDR